MSPIDLSQGPSTVTPWPKWLAVLVLVVVAGVGGGVAWSFWQGIFDTQDLIAAREDMLAGLKQAAARRALDPTQPGKPAEKRNPYLSGETETIAAAELQTLVLQKVEADAKTVFSTQVRPRSTLDQPLTPETTPGAKPDRQIDLEVVFDGRIGDIQKILFTLETGSPYIFIDEMQLQPAKLTQPGDAAEADPMLHVVLTMHGFWRS